MTKEQLLEELKAKIVELDQLWEASCDMDEAISEILTLSQVETED